MNKSELKNQISQILKVSPKDLESTAALGFTESWDSFAHVEIMLLLEEKFLVEMSEVTLEKYSNLKSILDLSSSSDL